MVGTSLQSHPSPTGDAISIGQKPGFTHVVFHHLGQGWHQEIHDIVCQGVDHEGEPLAKQSGRLGSL